MPASATITSFYTFQIATRPRIGNVNGNFANYRGHLIPIDPNSITAAANFEYGMGAPEYRWNYGYVAKFDLSLTSTTSLVFEANTAAEYHFKNAGVSGVYFATSGFYGFNETAFPGLTTSAELSGVAASAVLFATYSAAASPTIASVTIKTNGRPVLVFLNPDTNTSASSYIQSAMTGDGTGGGAYFCNVGFTRNGVTMGLSQIATPALAIGAFLPPGFFAFIDTPPAGQHTYQLMNSAPHYIDSGGNTVTANAHLYYSNIRLMAYEW